MGAHSFAFAKESSMHGSKYEETRYAQRHALDDHDGSRGPVPEVSGVGVDSAADETPEAEIPGLEPPVLETGDGAIVMNSRCAMCGVDMSPRDAPAGGEVCLGCGQSKSLLDYQQAEKRTAMCGGKDGKPGPCPGTKKGEDAQPAAKMATRAPTVPDVSGFGISRDNITVSPKQDKVSVVNRAGETHSFSKNASGRWEHHTGLPVPRNVEGLVDRLSKMNK